MITFIYITIYHIGSVSLESLIQADSGFPFQEVFLFHYLLNILSALFSVFSVLGHWLFEYGSPLHIYHHASYLFSAVSFHVLFSFLKPLLRISDSVFYKATFSSPYLSWIG